LNFQALVLPLGISDNSGGQRPCLDHERQP
jgi:hypothetical protein